MLITAKRLSQIIDNSTLTLRIFPRLQHLVKINEKKENDSGVVYQGAKMQSD